MSMTTGFSPKADAIRTDLQAAHDQIRSRTTQTLESRRVDHAKAQTAAQSAMDELAEQETGAAAAATQKLSRTAFGVGDLTRDASPADAASISIVARDAADRAGMLADAQSAMSLLLQAESLGDETLARAVGQRASLMGWDDVLQRYMDDRPKQADAINSLRALNDSPPSAASLFQYSLPVDPSLGTLSSFQINQLAGDPTNLAT